MIKYAFRIWSDNRYAATSIFFPHSQYIISSFLCEFLERREGGPFSDPDNPAVGVGASCRGPRALPFLQPTKDSLRSCAPFVRLSTKYSTHQTFVCFVKSFLVLLSIIAPPTKKDSIACVLIDRPGSPPPTPLTTECRLKRALITFGRSTPQSCWRRSLLWRIWTGSFDAS